jgi:outer membrane immunogenic protein
MLHIRHLRDFILTAGAEMQWSIVASAGLISVLAAAGPVVAAEIPVQPQAPAKVTKPAKKVVKRAPARPAPARVTPRPVAQQVAQSTPNWSGTQVGGFNGATQMSNAMVEPGAFLFFAPTFFGSPLTSSSANVETPYSFKGNPWSYTAGAFLGYNVQLGSYVVGAEGDIAWKNGSSGSNQYTLTPATYFGGTTLLRTESFNGTLKQTWDSSLRARAGFLYTPWTLIYATGGLAFGEVSGSFGYSAMITYPGAGTTSTSGGMSWSDTRVGWTAGGGVETEIAPQWKVRVEYRYTDLGSYSKNVPLSYSTSCTIGAACPSPSLISSGAVVNLHPTFQTIRVGLGFNF